ncbi:hypothetical protein BZG36_02399 [Bifiguratus adelaidae]|uniref:GH16 domain-containing protein n=1 Tax=Bifiguratus adelaidae TaxID=1938954 RepID=A0A261Y1B0_9FUNG|nr:hypothetical protein BZG36_02399 [Bifiguratus adelaidae]
MVAFRTSLFGFAFGFLPSAIGQTSSSTPPTSTNCDCGFQTNDGTIWANTFAVDWASYTQDIDADSALNIAQYQIEAKYKNTYPRTFSRQNVMAVDRSLNLIVKVNSSSVTCASIATTRKDILYGSFRAFVKTTTTPGTVASFYFYNSDVAEIDIELLSRLQSPWQAYYAIHPEVHNPDGSANYATWSYSNLSFDATQDFHEYRFDWLPGLTVFYVDAVEQYRSITNVPNVPGNIILNHWTDGNPSFSGGPPLHSAVMEVTNMTFYFNTSTPQTLVCQSMKTPCEVRSGKTLTNLQPATHSAASTNLRYSFLILWFYRILAVLVLVHLFL